jgi:hypothetical protein
MNYKIAASEEIRQVFPFLIKPITNGEYDWFFLHPRDKEIDPGLDKPMFMASIFDVDSVVEVSYYLEQAVNDVPDQIEFTRNDILGCIERFLEKHQHDQALKDRADELRQCITGESSGSCNHKP